jgi:uncharacterized cupin superfamily protein
VSHRDRPNVFAPEWDDPGARVRRASLGARLGTERLGLSLWELPPGEAAYPYHFHLAEEELLVVLAGAPLLRTPDGERTLAEGDVVAFPVGEAGAHELRNPGDADARFLAVSAQGTADVVVYPDEDIIATTDRRRDGTGLRAFFRREDAVASPRRPREG